ncbi:protein of unknown function [Methylorubrum extorquens DM4]|uniref:Uncharacterized protein n=1 Tax=Methylorubrum extorquens (strain DSM 6343 / CIP 106787 / DM4) TaxID=661410 RepID=C7CFS4_METED|nr:protein of unknown function [Methylorubrum extorquens DM4]
MAVPDVSGVDIHHDGFDTMKITLPVLVAAASLVLAPGYALAQHIDVGPGGVSVHGHSHGHVERHEHVERHHHHGDRHVDHHGSRERVTVEKHRH